jgi:hypothetical protein
MRSSRLLRHHLMQAPDDRPPCRRPHRHAEAESVDRHGVGGRGGVKIVNNARGQWGESAVIRTTHSRTDAARATSLKRLQPRLQRDQRLWL